MHPMAHRIIGCDWGRLVYLPDNREPCGNQAVQRTIIHNSGGEQLMVQLCEAHHHVLLQQTAPHTPREPGEGAP